MLGFAGVQGSAGPDFPLIVNVGQTFQGQLTITNLSDGANAPELVTVSGIFLTPSCGGSGAVCSAGDVDLGVFAIANPIADPTTACGVAGRTFLVGAPDASGQVEFTPDADVVLGPSFLPGGGGTLEQNQCRILFDVTVLKVPTKDAGALPAIQTNQLGQVVLLTAQPSGSTGFAGGSDTTTVTDPALTIAKTPDGQTITAGDTATFTIVVTNTGNGDANGVVIDDPLPAGLTWGTATAGCTVVANALHCDVGTLAPGASFTAVVTAQTSLQACATYPNTATAAASNAGQVQDDGTITCQVPVLQIVKTPDGQTIAAGDTATFTIVVTNLGPGSALNVVIDDPLPAGLTWGTATAGCTVVGNVLHCNVGTLAQGAFFTAVVTAQTSLQACATYPNTATAAASNAGQVQDNGLITCQTPVLQIVKTPDGQTITAGDTATFTIVVTNLGPGTALNVVIDDPLPAGLTWGTATAGCTVVANVLHCNVGTLAQGASFTAVVTAQTSLQACATYPNTATAAASNAGQVQDNGLITCQTPVLQIVKTPDGQTITAGDTATFTIVVTNLGPGSALNVVIDDPLPAGGGVTWGTATAGCTVVANVLHCDVGTLAQGAQFTAVVTAQTSLQACTDMPNTATASASNAASVQDPGDITCQPPQGEAICRTPGFWGTHGCGTSGSLNPADCEKQNGVGSHNITQLALDLAIDKAGESGDFIIVCGEQISNTEVPNAESAIEAICVKPSTDKGKALQAARQLTALVLNCAVTNPSTADAYCENTPFEELFNACTAACATAGNHVVTADVGGHTVNCVEAIDCVNNGHFFDPATGICSGDSGCHDETTFVGTCSQSGAFCSSNDPCDPVPGKTNTCQPGAAGSSKACNDAHDNNCTIFSTANPNCPI